MPSSAPTPDGTKALGECRACRFWSTVPRFENVGECHRASPVLGGGSNKRGQWPQTLDEDGCGDFEPSAETCKAFFDEFRTGLEQSRDLAPNLRAVDPATAEAFGSDDRIIPILGRIS